jgi:hypothetical protein
MLYSIIANFVMVACRVVYCEFRHGCKSGSCVSRRIKICVDLRRVNIRVDLRLRDANRRELMQILIRYARRSSAK